jgi:hypothetical protein
MLEMGKCCSLDNAIFIKKHEKLFHFSPALFDIFKAVWTYFLRQTAFFLIDYLWII